MSGWKYKTRCSEHPQDLPKVYFCCHPDDFPGLFPEISDSILTNVRCAIWYADDDTPRDEDFFALLSGMDLVVVPVTEKLLTDGCIAMQKDIPFALTCTGSKTPIPILPLLQSQSLEECYSSNPLFRNIQYLCKDILDPTVSSYEDKLKEYLNNVLLNAEQMKNIRAAFDGYIFFSYRKQDRKQLQELLDAIHRFPFCRDIALWYDEYLPTGEDFYSNIHTVMDKSALFVLSYTDSVLADRDGKPNFVIQDEIPSAYQKLPMLTVQMNKTAEPDALVTKLLQTAKDHPILSEATPDQIRQTLCFVSKKDAAMKPALFAQLKQAPKNLLGPLLYELLANAADMDAMQQNDEDPEHNYLIGLAYLHGVDTVKDVPLATELLDFASKHGYVDATEKLVHIYRYGIGTAQDLDKAIFFQKRLIAQREFIYQEAPDIHTWNDYIWAILDCGMLYLENHQLVSARSTCEWAFSLLKDSSEGAGTRLIHRTAMVCFAYLGDICLKQKDYAYAQDYCQMSQNEARLLAEQMTGFLPQRDLYLASLQRGDIAKTIRNYAIAEDHYTQGLDIALSIPEPKDSDDLIAWQQDLLGFYLALGDIGLFRKKYAQAGDYYEKHLKLSKQVSQNTNSIKSQTDLAISYERLGIYWHKDQPSTPIMAQYYFEKCIEVRRQIVQRSQEPDLLADLGYALYLLALVSPDERKPLLEEAISLYRKILPQHPDNQLYQGRYHDILRLFRS